MSFPPVKPAEVWAEEDAADTLPSLQEWTWDDDSIITRGRVSRRKRSAGIGWTLGGVGSTRPAELGDYHKTTIWVAGKGYLVEKNVTVI